MNKLMIAAATFAACAAAEAADFQIGVYCLKENARTEQHIKDIRDCHVDFVYGIECTDRKTLDLFAKYGLKAIHRPWSVPTRRSLSQGSLRGGRRRPLGRIAEGENGLLRGRRESHGIRRERPGAA